MSKTSKSAKPTSVWNVQVKIDAGFCEVVCPTEADARALAATLLAGAERRVTVRFAGTELNGSTITEVGECAINFATVSYTEVRVVELPLQGGTALIKR